MLLTSMFVLLDGGVLLRVGNTGGLLVLLSLLWVTSVKYL